MSGPVRDYRTIANNLGRASVKKDAKIQALEAQLTAQAEELDRLKVEVDWQARCVDIIAHGEGIEASLLPGLRAQLTAQAEELRLTKLGYEFELGEVRKHRNELQAHLTAQVEERTARECAEIALKARSGYVVTSILNAFSLDALSKEKDQ
jgi:hypothetical protein